MVDACQVNARSFYAEDLTALAALLVLAQSQFTAAIIAVISMTVTSPRPICVSRKPQIASATRAIATPPGSVNGAGSLSLFRRAMSATETLP